MRKPSSKEKSTTASGKLIFVIQEHHARRLHYDFRLELEGVLKSWAIPKGPSLDPKDKRLAIQTDDHSYTYKDFHGIIPQEEYGGGEVFIWDQGIWVPESDGPLKALEKGHLTFKLYGKKMKGSFTLRRMSAKNSENQKKWLLIKHQDKAAQSGYELIPISRK